MSAPRLLTRRLSRTSLVAVAAVGVTVSTLAVAAVPAQAAPGIGKGRAVVHVDSSKATTVKQADGSYLLSMPQGTTGQWMGERKVAGKTKVLVGNLTGEKLASSWSSLKYTSSGVTGTLVWDSTAAEPQFAAVQVMQPKSGAASVTFTLKTKQELPATMNNVMLNLDRAPKKSLRSSSTQSTNITSDLWWSSTDNSSSVTVRIYNSTNNNTCYSKGLDSSDSIKSVGSNTCDDIAYTDASNVGGSYPYGAGSGWKAANSNSNVYYLTSAQVSLLLTPPNQAQYKYFKSYSY